MTRALWAVGCACVLLLIAVILWVWLPRWAPSWVMNHSPWLDPTLRAMAIAVEREPEFSMALMDEGYSQRVRDWGSAKLPTLLDRLEDPSPWMRLAALRVMVEIADPFILPAPMVPRVCAMVVGDENPYVRCDAVFVVTTASWSPVIKQTLMQGMRDPEARVRSAAIGCFGGPVEEGDLPLFRELLQDTDNGVRYCMSRRLGQLRVERMIPELIQTMQRDSYSEVRVQSLYALSQMPTESSLAALRRTMLTKNSTLAYRAFSELYARRSVTGNDDFYREAMTSEDSAVRWLALEKLAHEPTPMRVEMLLPHLNDSDTWIAGKAALVLAGTGDARVIEPLLYHLQTGIGLFADCESFPIFGQQVAVLFMTELKAAMDRLPLSDEQKARWLAIQEQPTPAVPSPHGREHQSAGNHVR